MTAFTIRIARRKITAHLGTGDVLKTEAVLVKNISANTHLEDTKTRAGDKSLNKGSLKPRGMSENLAVPAERNGIQSAYKLRET